QVLVHAQYMYHRGHQHDAAPDPQQAKQNSSHHTQRQDQYCRQIIRSAGPTSFSPALPFSRANSTQAMPPSLEQRVTYTSSVRPASVANLLYWWFSPSRHVRMFFNSFFGYSCVCLQIPSQLTRSDYFQMPTDRKPEFFKGAQLKVGIIGCGYVGLPLALRFAEAGHKVTGFD